MVESLEKCDNYDLVMKQFIAQSGIYDSYLSNGKYSVTTNYIYWVLLLIFILAVLYFIYKCYSKYCKKNK